MSKKMCEGAVKKQHVACATRATGHCGFRRIWRLGQRHPAAVLLVLFVARLAAFSSEKKPEGHRVHIQVAQVEQQVHAVVDEDHLYDHGRVHDVPPQGLHSTTKNPMLQALQRHARRKPDVPAVRASLALALYNEDELGLIDELLFSLGHPYGENNGDGAASTSSATTGEDSRSRPSGTDVVDLANDHERDYTNIEDAAFSAGEDMRVAQRYRTGSSTSARNSTSSTATTTGSGTAARLDFQKSHPPSSLQLVTKEHGKIKKHKKDLDQRDGTTLKKKNKQSIIPESSTSSGSILDSTRLGKGVAAAVRDAFANELHVCRPAVRVTKVVVLPPEILNPSVSSPAILEDSTTAGDNVLPTSATTRSSSEVRTYHAAPGSPDSISAPSASTGTAMQPSSIPTNPEDNIKNSFEPMLHLEVGSTKLPRRSFPVQLDANQPRPKGEPKELAAFVDRAGSIMRNLLAEEKNRREREARRSKSWGEQEYEELLKSGEEGEVDGVRHEQYEKNHDADDEQDEVDEDSRTVEELSHMVPSTIFLQTQQEQTSQQEQMRSSQESLMHMFQHSLTARSVLELAGHGRKHMVLLDADENPFLPLDGIAKNDVGALMRNRRRNQDVTKEGRLMRLENSSEPLAKAKIEARSMLASPTSLSSTSTDGRLSRRMQPIRQEEEEKGYSDLDTIKWKMPYAKRKRHAPSFSSSLSASTKTHKPAGATISATFLAEQSFPTTPQKTSKEPGESVTNVLNNTSTNKQRASTFDIDEYDSDKDSSRAEKVPPGAVSHGAKGTTANNDNGGLGRDDDSYGSSDKKTTTVDGSTSSSGGSTPDASGGPSAEGLVPTMRKDHDIFNHNDVNGPGTASARTAPTSSSNYDDMSASTLTSAGPNKPLYAIVDLEVLNLDGSEKTTHLIRDALLGLQKGAGLGMLDYSFRVVLSETFLGEVTGRIMGFTDLDLAAHPAKDLTGNEYGLCLEEELFWEEKVSHQWKVLLFGFLVGLIFLITVSANYFLFTSYASRRHQDLLSRELPPVPFDEILSNIDEDEEDDWLDEVDYTFAPVDIEEYLQGQGQTQTAVLNNLEDDTSAVSSDEEVSTTPVNVAPGGGGGGNTATSRRTTERTLTEAIYVTDSEVEARRNKKGPEQTTTSTASSLAVKSKKGDHSSSSSGEEGDVLGATTSAGGGSSSNASGSSSSNAASSSESSDENVEGGTATTMMALRNAAAHGPSGNSTATSFTAANRRPVVPTSISTAAGGVSRGTAPVPPRRAPPSSSSTTVRPQATRARPAAPSAATPASSTTQQPPHQTVSNTIGTAIRSLFASPFLGTTSTSSSSSQQQSNTRPASVSTRPASRVSTRPASVSTRPASVATRPATVSTTSVRRPQSSSGFNSTTITSAEVPVRSRSRILDTNRGGQEVPSRGTAARSGPGTSSSSTTAAPPPPPATAFSTSSEAESSSATSVSPSKSRGRHVTGALEERKRSKK